MDVNKDNKIDYEEFYNFVQNIEGTNDYETADEVIREIFDHFDRNKDGFITLKEMRTTILKWQKGEE